MDYLRPITNIDTHEVAEISIPVAACAGGYTFQVFAITPTLVYPSPDAAADAYAVRAQARFDQQIISERGKPAPARCCFCGAPLNRRGECEGCR